MIICLNSGVIGTYIACPKTLTQIPQGKSAWNQCVWHERCDRVQE